MNRMKNLIEGLKALIDKQHVECEMDEELDGYLEASAADKQKLGMSKDEALRAARVEMGSRNAVKHKLWSSRWESAVDRLFQDIRLSLRMLAKSPGFTAAVIGTLALGIGATTAIFSVFYAVLLAPLPYRDPNQLMVVWSMASFGRASTSVPDFLDWQAQNSSFQMLGTGDSLDFNLSTSGAPEYIHGAHLTVGYLDKMIGERPWMGRYFLPEEGQPGRDHVTIITHKLWQRLGSRPDMIGQQIRLNGELYTVVGVRPPGYPDRMSGSGEIILPTVYKPEDRTNREFHPLIVLGRLKPGVTVAQAQADMQVIAERIAQEHPESNKGWKISVEPLHNDFLPSNVRMVLWLLMAATGSLLLIACANVANFLLARATVRQREVALRASLGAGRGRLIAQFLTESLMLALSGGVLGVALGAAILKLVIFLMPINSLPSEADVRLNLPVLLFTVVVSLACGVFFGVMPAWQAAHVDPNEVLKEGGRAGTSRSRQRMRRILVAGEFALTMTLLASAGLTIHNFYNLTHVDLGFRTDHILTFTLPVPTKRLSEPAKIVSFYDQVLEKVRAVTGVSAAEVGTDVPLTGPGFGLPVGLAGRPDPPGAKTEGTAVLMVTPEYISVFGIHTLEGRAIDSGDRAGSTRVVMVNETFAKRYLSGLEPWQEHLRLGQFVPGLERIGPLADWQIIGIFQDFRDGGLRQQKPFPEIILPFAQSPWPQAQIAVRTFGDPEQITRSIAATVASVDPDLPLANVKTMDQIVSGSMGGDRFVMALYGGFAAIALLLAVAGIYGVMAFAVAQRTQEIGVRMALGASPGSVLSIVLKDGMVLAGYGLLLGLAGALVVGRVMKSMLYEMGAVDVTVLAAVTFVLLFSALFACYLPARRASRVDPMTALRYE
jgi:predicted permease